MAQTIIEELLGWQGNISGDSETSSRRYYIQADNPEKAKKDFEAFAKLIPPVHGYEMSFGIDEEREADKLYFGSITFRTLSPKVKYRIDDSLQELVGDKNSEGRSSASRERLFRVQGINAVDARNRLENYIRTNAVTSGRLHIDEISVDESPNGDGFYSGRVTWGLPATHGPRDKIEGIVPAYGGRVMATQNSITTERVFELRGFPNYEAAWWALYNNYGRYDDVESVDVDENADGANELYTGRVRYVSQTEEEPQPTRSFEISGSQTKMTSSLLTRAGFAINGNPRNYGGLIGVTNDGVEGVDIDTAVSTFTETVHFYPWQMTQQYVAFLGRAYGCVNEYAFRGFEPGEVRFLGASGTYKQGDQSVELTFKFAVSPNAYGITVGNMYIPFKYGWDYLWVRWEEVKVGETTVKVPAEAYIEQVYSGMNFGMLGIGW